MGARAGMWPLARVGGAAARCRNFGGLFFCPAAGHRICIFFFFGVSFSVYPSFIITLFH